LKGVAARPLSIDGSTCVQRTSPTAGYRIACVYRSSAPASAEPGHASHTLRVAAPPRKRWPRPNASGAIEYDGRVAARLGIGAFAVAFAVAGCGRSIVRLHPGNAKRHEVATVALETRTSKVVAFDDHPLPEPARHPAAVAVELLPGGHCVQLLSPRLFNAFDRPDASYPVRPSELPSAYWFEVRAGGSYVIRDYVTQAQMLDILQVDISEMTPDGSSRHIGGTFVLPPAQGVTCRPFRTRESASLDGRAGVPPTSFAAPRDASVPSRDASVPSRDGMVPTARTTTYKGHTIDWNEAVDPPRLTINGQPVAVQKSGSGKDLEYGADVLSYAKYPTMLQLAQALIDTKVIR